MSDGGDWTPSVLIVDDTPDNLAVLVDVLGCGGFEVLVARSGEQALELLRYSIPDLILLDVVMPGIDGFETCRRLKADERTQPIPVIFMTALTDTTDKVRSFQLGAVDYVTKPFEAEEVMGRVRTHVTLRKLQEEAQEANARLLVANDELEQRVAARTDELRAALTEVEALRDRLEDENTYLRQEIRQSVNADELIGASPSHTELLGLIAQVAPTDASVLITGETGTGKELVARAIHEASSRQQRPLIKVNCAALPAALVESELFGHERGAFTGATAQRVGRFEVADRGTIFLDEIGELPLELQSKLLRVLQEGEFERVGGSDTIRADVRVIAATNRDIEEAVARGEFRDDLFYRLNVFPIRCPPLRERQGDIPLLVDHFVDKSSVKVGKEPPAIPDTVMAQLEGYAWPGNVRELANVIERAVIVSAGGTLGLGPWLTGAAGPTGTAGRTLMEVERAHIVRVLETTSWRVRGPGGAAEVLGVKPTTLESRMQKLGVHRSD